VFDFDGLIIDSEYEIARAVLCVLNTRGALISLDAISHLFGSTAMDTEWEDLLDSLFQGAFTLEQLDAELATVLPARIDALPLLPGVLNVLDDARALGWRVGLATGQEPNRLHEHLTRLAIADRFDAIVTAAEVEHGKPAPDIFLEVSRRLGVPTDRCLALEDSLPGCAAALTAGMKVTVCPSRVTASCAFPVSVHRVRSLTELRLEASPGGG
jgi:HAD superfamily hydrolase (TIGR01509 family)